MGVIGGQPAAVTVVDLFKERGMKAEMQIEVEIYRRLRSLQGVYIPHLLAHGYIDGWQYFLATSLECPSLESNEAWPEDAAATTMSAIRALDKVHQLGVLHGDVSLHNFVFASGSAPEQALLQGFDCAQLAADAAQAAGVEAAVLLAEERRKLMYELGVDEQQQGVLGAGGSCGDGGWSGGSSGTGAQPAGAPARHGPPPPAAVVPSWLLRGPAATRP
ncbi:hypothetical protein GPECTOR_6g483 [Gonium pectorale]|uniref:Protein kinase domain-containing protein n=1 Tax=Gonium pectorale TaxID=33097 RepID=A0A150GUL7_GONPE|nr:hypothetical protein GPECTOR_6g483 [Gonium pectorale]|eukprot:KXZ53566.1 hypothetical protein GPECTOR_6g483 [Gonium pectorale]